MEIESAAQGDNSGGISSSTVNLLQVDTES